MSLSSLVRGPDSLGSLLELHGYTTTPSSSYPVPVSEDALRSTLSAALVGIDTKLPANERGQTSAQHRLAREEAVTDALEDLLVRNGYAESKLHANAAAVSLLPFTATGCVTAPVPGTGARLVNRRSQGSYEKAEFDISRVEPPAVELQPESEPQAQEAESASEGVYFGGAYTVRCYGVGAEVRGCVPG